MNNLNKIFPEDISKIILLYSKNEFIIYIVDYAYGYQRHDLHMYKSLESAHKYMISTAEKHNQFCSSSWLSRENSCDLCSICSSGKHIIDCVQCATDFSEGDEIGLCCFTCEKCNQIIENNIKEGWWCETCEEESVTLEERYINLSTNDLMFSIEIQP